MPIPLKVSVSATSGLHDGQVVTVTVTADKGSAFYGMDARLCAGDRRPSPPSTTTRPIRPATASCTPVGRLGRLPGGPGRSALPDRDAAPSGWVWAPSTFTTENLTKVAITCGPGHPCQLVVRLQYPHGFGFKAFPLTFAG